MCFHQGTEALSLSTEADRAHLRQVAAAQLSAAGQLQLDTYLQMLQALEAHLVGVRRRLVAAAGHLRGPKVLTERLYGVGPVTALALTCWLGGAGRFSSSRKAVRFAGLDVTVYSSDGKRSPGRLSRQGPPVLRWCLYEAGKQHSRRSASTTPTTRGSRTASTANARHCRRPASSSARPATSSPSSATTRSPRRDPTVTTSGTGCAGTAPLSRWDNRGQLPTWSCRTRPALPRRAITGRPGKTERPQSPAGGGHPIHHHVAGPSRKARGPR